jgi:hypothetical protein
MMLNKIMFNTVRFTADALGTIKIWLFLHLHISISKRVRQIFLHLQSSSIFDPKQNYIKESTLLLVCFSAALPEEVPQTWNISVLRIVQNVTVYEESFDIKQNSRTHPVSTIPIIILKGMDLCSHNLKYLPQRSSWGIILEIQFWL